MKHKIIYPIQPYFVMNSMEYYKKNSRHPAIAHFYKFKGNENAEFCYAVPDGAIDIIFQCDEEDPGARICGTVSQGKQAGFKNDTTYFGVRFLPGHFDHIGNLSIRDLVQNYLSMDDVFRKEGLLERIVTEQSFEAQADIFEESFLKNIEIANYSTYKISSAIIQEIYDSDGAIHVKELEERLNYSRRHLIRCFEATMGMDIKTFANYIRFQSILQRMNRREFQTLSDAAMAGNYYDQTHFQKEFKKFAAATPGTYLKLLKEMNYQERLTVL